jgi:membrane-associated phospholipid phosphatase
VDAFSAAMEYFPFVFHPVVLVGGGFLLLIHTEWRRQDAGHDTLRKRLGVFVVAGFLSILPTAVYLLVTGQGPMETMQGNAWQVDAIVASGLAVVAGSLWVVWTRYEWGHIVPRAAVALAAGTVPYVGLSPFWNVSGHVTLAVVSTLTLVLVNRRFWPLLAVPAVMVVNRPYVDAHTWGQSVGALLIATGVVVAVFRLHPDTIERSPSSSNPR